MLIPIGHEHQTVQRLPWVSFAIIAVNIVMFIVFGVMAGGASKQALTEKFAAAMNYWHQHPYLTLPESVLREAFPQMPHSQLLALIEAMKSSSSPPASQEEREQEQRQLDTLVRDLVDVRDADPARRWGLVPAHLEPVTVITSMFMHAGWLHLLGNMLFFYLAGPFLEDIYGRPIFAALYFGTGIVASLAHVATFPASEVPLVGASGAIAGLMGAFVIRAARTKIKFFYWLWIVRAGTFEAPAWLMLPLWLAIQLFYALLVKSESGVAYWAHVAGFLAGVAAAVGIKYFEVEEKVVRPAIAARTEINAPAALEEGMNFLAQGNVVAAREAFKRVLAADPSNPDAHLEMWQAYIHEGQPVKGFEHMVRVIEHELRRGEITLARDHWQEMVRTCGLGGPAAIRWRLASALEEGDPASALEVYSHLGQDRDGGMLGQKARAKAQALGAAELPPPTPPAGAPSPPPGPLPEPRPMPASPNATAASAAPATATMPLEFEAPDRPLPARVAPQVELCAMEALRDDGITVQGQGAGIELLPYVRVEAVAIAGITGTAKPYVVLDLIMPNEFGPGHRIARFQSTSLDPRRLTGRVDLAPMEAFRDLVRKVVRGARARVLPTPTVLEGGRVPTFATVDEYERTVLATYL